MSAPQGDDLERRLGELFEQRAATVSQARRIDLGADDSGRTAAAAGPARNGRLRETLGLLAAAAVVFIAIASTVVGIREFHQWQLRNAADNHGPTAPPPPSMTGPGKPCVVTAPASWRQAIDAGTVPVDRSLNTVISANKGTGDYLVLQGNEPPSQTSAIYSDIEVALFQGSRGVTIFTPEGSDIPQAAPTGAISADWVTFAVARLQDLNPSYNVKYSYKVMLYDRGAGVTRTLVEMPREPYSPGKSVLGAPVIAAGKVHWLATVHNKPETTTLESWDLAQNSAAGSVQAANATSLVSYGTGVALLRSRDSGTTRFLQNGAGAPLTQTQLSATASGLNFGFDGVSRLSWVGSDRGLDSRSTLGLAFHTASVEGGAKISAEPLYPTSLDLASYPAIDNGGAHPAVHPFVAVAVNGSGGLLDMRTGRAIALPEGVSLQGVVGDEVIFGTGATKSGAAGLSRVALTALPPVSC